MYLFCVFMIFFGYNTVDVLMGGVLFVFFFKQQTAYEMRISDWSSDVCSSDLNRFVQLITSYCSIYRIFCCTTATNRLRNAILVKNWFTAGPLHGDSEADRKSVV